MSRLDSVIRRLQAQRQCLDSAAHLIADKSGVVLELGLGNGRTYDHLRELLPDRDIYVFDRQVAAHPDCIPDKQHLFLGDIHDTLKQAVQQFPHKCVLIHCDIGTGIDEENRKIAEFLSRALEPLLKEGAVVVSDQPLHMKDARDLPLPDDVPKERYFMIEKLH